jgi:hypothetical protein
MEAMVVIGFVLILMIPLLYMAFGRVATLREELNTAQAKRAVETIGTAISIVGVIGPNGSAEIEIDLPANVKRADIGSASPREVSLTLSTSLGDIDISQVVAYNVTGSIATRSGKQKVSIVYYESGPPILVSSENS